MATQKMKDFYVTVNCQAVYNSSIKVPEHMTEEEALIYAKNHLSEIPIATQLEYVSNSDWLDEDNCSF